MFAGRYNKGRPGHGILVPQVPWHQEMVSPEPIIQMHLASSPRLGRGEQRHMNVLESHEQTNSGLETIRAGRLQVCRSLNWVDTRIDTIHIPFTQGSYCMEPGKLLTQ